MVNLIIIAIINPLIIAIIIHLLCINTQKMYNYFILSKMEPSPDNKNFVRPAELNSFGDYVAYKQFIFKSLQCPIFENRNHYIVLMCLKIQNLLHNLPLSLRHPNEKTFSNILKIIDILGMILETDDSNTYTIFSDNMTVENTNTGHNIIVGTVNEDSLFKEQFHDIESIYQNLKTLFTPYPPSFDNYSKLLEIIALNWYPKNDSRLEDFINTINYYGSLNRKIDNYEDFTDLFDYDTETSSIFSILNEVFKIRKDDHTVHNFYHDIDYFQKRGYNTTLVRYLTDADQITKNIKLLKLLEKIDNLCLRLQIFDFLNNDNDIVGALNKLGITNKGCKDNSFTLDISLPFIQNFILALTLLWNVEDNHKFIIAFVSANLYPIYDSKSYYAFNLNSYKWVKKDFDTNIIIAENSADIVYYYSFLKEMNNNRQINDIISS
jgi:hypothetical protein